MPDSVEEERERDCPVCFQRVLPVAKEDKLVCPDCQHVFAGP